MTSPKEAKRIKAKIDENRTLVTITDILSQQLPRETQAQLLNKANITVKKDINKIWLTIAIAKHLV